MPKLIYYAIAVGSPSAKRKAIFTYSAETRLSPGHVVMVPLKRTVVMGVVLATVPAPDYPVKMVTLAIDFCLPAQSIGLLRWMLDFYPTDQGATVRLFCPSRPPLKKRQLPSPLPAHVLEENVNVPLTTDQQQAITTINITKGPAILFGATGSGKTRVYEELTKKVIAAGKSVLFLAPEISLGQHLMTNLDKKFSNPLSYHSLMTPAERRNVWYGLAGSKAAHVVIGPRSALFLPINNLGLIIIDEAHDQSYKNQQTPYYSTLQVATRLSHELRIPLVYGSATPNVTDFYAAVNKSLPIIKMTERPVQSKTRATPPSFTVYSLRDTHLFTRSAFIARPIIDRMQSNLERGTQTLLLLNRRGTAQLIRCEACGWEMECDTCHHAVVYHKDIHKAVCHICGKNYPMAHACPDCRGVVRMHVVGTKYIEEHVRGLFPNATIVRLDSDSLDRRDIVATLSSLQTGEASIVIGTQLLAKGLDLPFLSTIVILDAARQSSDYLSDERYYQLLHQVIGRGMRGHQATDIHIQSHQADDPIIQLAMKEDWLAFYRLELEERKKFGYPPFTYLANATFERNSQEVAERNVRQFSGALTKKNIAIQLLGPIPDFNTRSKKPVWRVLLKSPSRQKLINAAHLAPSDWLIDFEPIHV